MIKLFNERWDRVPLAVIDVETTGVDPWRNGVCQVAVIRFEGGEAVDSGDSLIDPGHPIPPEATQIHGITDEMVQGAPTIEQWFADPRTARLLEGAQPAAYHQAFDRQFVPTWAFADPHWPSGRHKLEVACERHGVKLGIAHNAHADAKAAGELFYVVLRKLVESHQDFEWLSDATVGDLLKWQREAEAHDWWRFCSWLSKQPPRQEAAAQ